MAPFISEDQLLKRMHATLGHVAGVLNVPVSVILWDGSSAPLGDTNCGASIAIKSPGVIASLLRRPSIENLVGHYAAGNISFSGDFITSGQAIRKQNLRRLDKKLLVRLLWLFLFVRGAKALTQHGFGEDATGTRHANKNNKAYIQFHYDVSNEFYQLFLDPQMQYSCAYFTDWSNSLEQAQHDKMDMTCRKLRLKEGERFLDIGCGWGGLICHAAQHYGVKAHGITLSERQYGFANEKIRALGLEGRVSVEIRDYLTLDGEYDKIASIGMFEHIGLANFPAYFHKIHSLLTPRGMLLNHGIARRAKAGGKKALSRITPEKRMILKYIFPGGELAPIGDTLNAMEACGFEVHDVEAWREHYALTSQHWYRRLSASSERAIALVGPERYRLWAAYLAGVSFGFRSGSMLVFQALATKRSKEKRDSGLPPTRADLYSSPARP
jgi:cyclopropane-fatty-acyl-phospholipid synthase